LTSLPERQQLVERFNHAVASGARKAVACAEIGLSLRSLQRWALPPVMQADVRTTTLRPRPLNALSAEERGAILDVCNSAPFASLPPSQIVPRLADQGRYLASEATFYRVLKAADQQHRRGRSHVPHKHAAPTTHSATKANQVWSWDITYLPSPVRGQYYYLYLIEDIYSRKGVGWEVYAQESGERAAELMQRTVLNERCAGKPLVLHSDNGALMKSSTLLSKLYDLGITPSRGRPRVSNDNPYSESLFRTLKYCPQWPKDGFANLDAARSWVRDFICWYNHEHRHSRIRFVTPAQRHRGEDQEVLAKRHAPASAQSTPTSPVRRDAELATHRGLHTQPREGATGTENGCIKKTADATTTLQNAAISAYQTFQLLTGHVLKVLSNYGTERVINFV
jgi:putative transposase